MADPDIPARQSPYTGGINTTYPGSRQPSSTTDLPFVDSGTTGKGWARGWARPFMEYLTGRKSVESGATARIKPAGTRSMIRPTDPDLQSGPSPEGITRIVSQKLGGATGPSAGSESIVRMGAIPYFGNWLYIPHQNINRRDGGKISRAVPGGGPSIDDGAQIPAIFAGNAPKG